eukprot:347272-Amphidinium_carterae.1
MPSQLLLSKAASPDCHPSSPFAHPLTSLHHQEARTARHGQLGVGTHHSSTTMLYRPLAASDLSKTSASVQDTAHNWPGASLNFMVWRGEPGSSLLSAIARGRKV